MKTRSGWRSAAGALFSRCPRWRRRPPEVTLTRIELRHGAKPTMVAEALSDTFAYSKDLALTFTFSCLPD